MLLSLPLSIPRGNAMRATSPNVDSELHVQLHISSGVLVDPVPGGATPPSEEQDPMSDKYQGFVQSPIGKLLVNSLGLPNPVKLERYAEGAPLVEGTIALGGRGRLAESLNG